MVPASPDAVDVDFNNSHARLRMNHLKVFDDHDLANSLTFGLGLPGDLGFPYPQISPVAPVRAFVSFDVEWNGALETAEIHNTAEHFEGTFLKTGATIRWSSEQPGFHFRSETPPDPSGNLVSVLGHERNGFFSVS